VVDGVVAMAAAVLRGEAVERAPVDVSLHVVAETLQGHFDADGTGVSAQTCRRLCCDAGIAPVVEGAGGEVLGVGRKTRTIPPAIKRALAARDGGCRFPGCSNRRFVDGHHVWHWGEGGRTELGNLVSLCRRHHRFVHELGFGVTMSEGAPVFVDPNGAVIHDAAKRPSVYDALARFARAAEVNRSRWDGTRPDHGAVIDALLGAAT
jgi:hypothetical protein